MKWTDQQFEPSGRNPRNNLQHMLAELRTQPGRWAEVGRYEPHRRGSALSRGSQTQKRYPELEYHVQREGEEYVLYFRVTGEG